MEPFWLIGLVAVGGIAAVAAIVGSYRAEQKRTEHMAQTAREMGFSFEPEGAALLGAGLARLPLCGRGHSKKARNVMRKVVRGTEVVLFDYQYTVGSGKNRHTHRHTVAAFHAADAEAFPQFEMRPEHLLHKLGALFGYQDIDFETHAPFSARYLVRGTQEEAVRAMFGGAVLDFFESSPQGWSVEAGSHWIAVYKKGRVDPGELRAFLTDATRVFLLFVPRSGVAEES